MHLLLINFVVAVVVVVLVVLRNVFYRVGERPEITYSINTCMKCSNVQSIFVRAECHSVDRACLVYIIS